MPRRCEPLDPAPFSIFIVRQCFKTFGMISAINNEGLHDERLKNTILAGAFTIVLLGMCVFDRLRSLPHGHCMFVQPGVWEHAFRLDTLRIPDFSTNGGTRIGASLLNGLVRAAIGRRFRFGRWQMVLHSCPPILFRRGVSSHAVTVGVTNRYFNERTSRSGLKRDPPITPRITRRWQPSFRILITIIIVLHATYASIGECHVRACDEQEMWSRGEQVVRRDHLKSMKKKTLPSRRAAVYAGRLPILLPANPMALTIRVARPSCSLSRGLSMLGIRCRRMLITTSTAKVS